jgi:hypothetical protein
MSSSIQRALGAEWGLWPQLCETNDELRAVIILS